METENECHKSPAVADRLYTVRDLARATGGTVPEGFIRAACHRARDCHPLPHIETGTKRKVMRIRLSDFERWLGEEALR